MPGSAARSDITAAAFIAVRDSPVGPVGGEGCPSPHSCRLAARATRSTRSTTTVRGRTAGNEPPATIPPGSSLPHRSPSFPTSVRRHGPTGAPSSPIGRATANGSRRAIPAPGDVPAAGAIPAAGRRRAGSPGRRGPGRPGPTRRGCRAAGRARDRQGAADMLFDEDDGEPIIRGGPHGPQQAVHDARREAQREFVGEQDRGPARQGARGSPSAPVPRRAARPADRGARPARGRSTGRGPGPHRPTRSWRCGGLQAGQCLGGEPTLSPHQEGASTVARSRGLGHVRARSPVPDLRPCSRLARRRWTRMVCSVQWCMGLNETAWGSLS